MKLGEWQKENKVFLAVIKSILELLDSTAEDEAFHRLKGQMRGSGEGKLIAS
jgi:hypothetical protein